MVHGDQQAQRRHRDYERTERMAVAERLRDVEAKLNQALRDLDRLERMLTGGYATVQSCPDDL